MTVEGRVPLRNAYSVSINSACERPASEGNVCAADLAPGAVSA